MIEQSIQELIQYGIAKELVTEDTTMDEVVAMITGASTTS